MSEAKEAKMGKPIKTATAVSRTASSNRPSRNKKPPCRFEFEEKGATPKRKRAAAKRNASPSPKRRRKQSVTIQTNLGDMVLAILHPAASRTTMGAVFVGGRGGGIHGPAGMYEDLATSLQQQGVSTLRVDYRRRNKLDECVADTRAGVKYLAKLGVEKVVLLGWSFGGAVVITAGVDVGEVVGVATVASHPAGMEDVGRLAPNKNLLLLHGTADQCLPPRCSEDLYARAGEPKEIVLFPGDNHGLTSHRAEAIQKLENWIVEVLQSPQRPS